MDSTLATVRIGPLSPGVPEQQGRISLANFALIAAQLAAVLVLLRQFQIESTAFLQLAAVVFAGFALHAFLPLRLRPLFFSTLSLASVPMVLGLVNGLWLLAIGFVLIGICHLPFSFRARAVVLLSVGALLTAQRSTLLPFPWPEAIWPILGSMFMFRLIVYFYDLRHDSVPVTPAQSVGYFFMVPNACFPLFPVVDFKTFRRNYYSSDAHEIYQTGINWMVRGVIHLILYRYIYYHVTLAPSEVNNPADFMQHVVSNFLLYLRVSGLFHLIVGMLYLFGFQLPETHNRYLLASSFTDFWRRINIYWKDFMQKIFYLPAVFALKRLGTTAAILIATLYVFVLTWALHSYQWFWLRGAVLIAWHDILFWAFLGMLVVVNSLYEIKFGRQRRLGKPEWNWRRGLVTVAKTYAMFWIICVLWSLWTSESVTAWLSLLSALGGPYTVDFLLFPGMVFAVIALGSIPKRKMETASTVYAARRAWRLDRAIAVASMTALVVVSVEGIHKMLGPDVATLVHSLRQAHLSRLDNARLERGYYEGLMSVDRFNSQLWEVYSKKPSKWLEIEHAGLKRFVADFAQVELVPSFVSTTKYGAITINRWGGRDKDYTESRPVGALRAVVLGPSTVMGWGVADGATFDAILEDRLNSQPVTSAFNRVELLNFGVPGHQPPQQMVVFDKTARLQPNALIYVAVDREMSRSAEYMAAAVRKRIAIPYPALQAIVDKSGVRPEMDETTALRQLQPYRADILRAVYGYIIQRSRERGVRPVWLFMPHVRERAGVQEETAAVLEIARDAGFVTIDLDDVYKGREVAAIRLAEWDDHPNALGHQLVADRLYAILATNPELLFGVGARINR
jgi:D-alanyl-lipoteichoic acid acyltransferase DltB (MBOAT superfamily)